MSSTQVKSQFGQDLSKVKDFVAKIDQKLRNKLNLSALGTESFGMEGLNDTQRHMVTEAEDVIGSALESAHNSAIGRDITEAQKAAGIQAALLADRWRSANTRTLRETMPTGATIENTTSVEAFGSDVVATRTYANEAYDERDNRNALAFSIAYNVGAARQDQFGEANYPTITIPADQASISIATNIMVVMENVERNISGAAYKLGRKNLIRAIANAKILRNDTTTIRPVYRDQSAANLVDPAIVPTVTYNDDGEEYESSPLLFGKTIDLLAISQPNALLNAGIQNQTDTLEPDVDVKKVYLTADDNTFGINTSALVGFNFVPSVQGDYKLMVLTADNSDVILNSKSKNNDGSDFGGALAKIADMDLKVRLNLVLNGSVTLDKGNIVVYANRFKVVEVQDANADRIALTDASIADLVTALDAASFEGYDPKAFRSNMNRRQQGQFIDVYTEFQRYNVPLRSPITARHPAHSDSSTDTRDVEALIAATRTRLCNESITFILETIEQLRHFVDMRSVDDEAPAVLGCGRHYIRPAFIERTFNAPEKIDSEKSFERSRDIQAAILNEVRDMVHIVYRDSEFKAAAESLTGGAGVITKVYLNTDPYTARYLMDTGDLKTLGGEFDYEVITNLDTRLRGMIIVTFTVNDSTRNQSPHPLNNGNLLWGPEMVLTANITRAGQFSRETLVQPRYRFIQNLPLMAVLKVENIPSVLGKVPLYINDVTPPAAAPAPAGP